MADKPVQPPEITTRKKLFKDFDVFISCASEDRDLAKSLSEALARRGVRCWFDVERIKPGSDWPRQLQEAIDRSRMCLVVLSEATETSPWISREWSLIQSSVWERDDLQITPLIVGRVAMPAFLRPWQAIRCDRERLELDRLVPAIIARLVDTQRVQKKEPDSELAEAAQRFRRIRYAIEEHDSINTVGEKQVPGE